MSYPRYKNHCIQARLQTFMPLVRWLWMLTVPRKCEHIFSVSFLITDNSQGKGSHSLMCVEFIQARIYHINFTPITCNWNIQTRKVIYEHFLLCVLLNYSNMWDNIYDYGFYIFLVALLMILLCICFWSWIIRCLKISFFLISC